MTEKFVTLPSDLVDSIMDALKNAGMPGYMAQAEYVLEALEDQIHKQNCIDNATNQEPVAWMFNSGDVWKFRWHHWNRPLGVEALKYWKPLYTRQKTLQPIPNTGNRVCCCCGGTGRMIRDADIGTDQECFVCNGTGRIDEK